MADIQEQPYETVRVGHAEMENIFFDILMRHGFSGSRARTCAQVFTENSIDGVYTHGVNRFPRFVQYVKDGYVQAAADPVKTGGFGNMEQWNGNLGPGPLNALQATDRAMALSAEHGMGCVALSNTNHWMRGGWYGWRAAAKGFVFIGWTNTIANMPAWKASDSRLGNNPLVIAVPYLNDAIVLDMAMSQYSFGAIEQYKNKGQQLEVPGGYDMQGEMTRDPKAIFASQKGLPVGYWKGAGLALLLDILATILSGGNSTAVITGKGTEFAVSQVFIAIHLAALPNFQGIEQAITGIISDYHGSHTPEGERPVIYPGERVMHTRKENLAQGIPVAQNVWRDIQSL